MADEELKKYSREEIKEHRSSESTWIVVDGKVYDVTEFLDEHPGGEEVMMEHAGRDATEAFEDVGHSPDAKDIQKKYLIGEVAEEKLGKKPQTSGNTASGDSSSNKPASTSWSTTSLVLLFLVLLAAYVYRNYTHIFGTEQKGQ